MFEVRGCLGCAIDDLLKESTILRMKTSHQHVQCRLPGTLVLEDAISFVCPDIFSRIRIPPEAACVTESLGFGQVSFAPAKLLSKSLVLRDIYGVANDSFQHPVFYNRGTDAANMSDFAVRSRKSFGDITS